MFGFYDAYIVVFLVTFLLGSIPFGLIISRVFYRTDIREHGSGNIGTTNAIRTMGKVGGFSVFILDFGKGVLSGFVGLWIGQAFLGFYGYDLASAPLVSYMTPWALTPPSVEPSSAAYLTQILLAISFLGCIWGHIFSPWLKFKGGKGIAVAIGCLFVTLGFPAAILELAVFIVLVLVTRYVSVGSIAAAVLCLFLGVYLFWGNWSAVILCAVAALTIVWAHRENIRRLLGGTESRIGDKKRSEDS